MNEYSASADLMDSFRSSSDLVKIIWLFLPIFLLGVSAVLLSAIQRFKSKPLLNLEHPDLGLIHIYQDSKALAVLSSLKKLPSLLQLHLVKDIKPEE